MSLDKERMAVAIGKNGETKKKIEELTGTIIKIDSNTGEFQVEPNKDENPVDEDSIPFDPSVRAYATINILKAIGYGFNPDKALKLLDPEYTIETVDLEDILGHSENKLTRIKGRIIGDKGKIRAAIEQFSEVHLSVYNRYLSIIGDFEAIKLAKKAINMIMDGAPHKVVLNFLQKKYQEKKHEDFTQIWKPKL